jgi:hypothetical protein
VTATQTTNKMSNLLRTEKTSTVDLKLTYVKFRLPK